MLLLAWYFELSSAEVLTAKKSSLLAKVSAEVSSLVESIIVGHFSVFLVSLDLSSQAALVNRNFAPQNWTQVSKTHLFLERLPDF